MHTFHLFWEKRTLADLPVPFEFDENAKICFAMLAKLWAKQILLCLATSWYGSSFENTDTPWNEKFWSRTPGSALLPSARIVSSVLRCGGPVVAKFCHSGRGNSHMYLHDSRYNIRRTKTYVCTRQQCTQKTSFRDCLSRGRQGAGNGLPPAYTSLWLEEP